jgi:hypothetical protein
MEARLRPRHIPCLLLDKIPAFFQPALTRTGAGLSDVFAGRKKSRRANL